MTWAPVKGYASYEVSDDGLVRNKVTGCIRRLHVSPFGYMLITIRHAGRQRTLKVHRLVLEAFAGPSPHRFDCNHIDGNKQNNRLSNLEWVSRRENLLHARRVLGLARGVAHGQTKLSESDVRTIRTTTGESTRSLAKRFRISQTAVCHIITRKTWIHI